MNDFGIVDAPPAHASRLLLRFHGARIGVITLIRVYGIRLCDELALLDVA